MVAAALARGGATATLGVAAARQTLLKKLAGVGQAAGHRPLFQPQLFSDLGAALALQAAQDEDHPVFLGQPADLLVEDGLEFAPGQVQGRLTGGHARSLAFVAVAPAGVAFGAKGGAVSGAVQPTHQGFPLADRGGLPRQDQERGLQGILGVLGVVQDAPANLLHHRPMSLDQLREGVLIAAEEEQFQQLSIRQVATGRRANRASELADASQGIVELRGDHVRISPGKEAEPSVSFPPGSRRSIFPGAMPLPLATPLVVSSAASGSP
jgi:hypothetical protein